ncbi:MAG TPA: glycosyltransferase family 4 protein [Nitrososphaerales archaeon]|nr:glycosyltransferase family 4 protein [Nitrososphaerales archaeon]
MNICLVSYELPPLGGGEGTYTYNLAKGLAYLGHKVVLVVPEQVAVIASQELQPDLVVVKPVKTSQRPLMKVSSFLNGFFRLAPSLVREFELDVIHVTFDYPPFPVTIGRLGAPVVCTLHHLHNVEALNIIHHQKNLLSILPTLARLTMLSMAERRLMSQCQGILAVSNFTRVSAVRYAGIDQHKISVVSNGIDIALYSKTDRIGATTDFCKKFGITTSEKVVLYVGRIEKSKGIEFLLEGFVQVRKKLSDARLVIVGGGSSSYVAELKKLNEDLGQRAIFTGRIDERLLLGAYSASSVVVLPSFMEGFGLTLLEAMVSGKPVVATRVGAVPEAVEDGVSGFLVEPGKPADLANRILQILENPLLGARMGKNGMEEVLGNYTLLRMAQNTENFYLRILGRNCEKG